MTAKKKIFRFFLKLFIWSFAFIVVLAITGMIGAVMVYREIAKDLPQISVLKAYRPPTITRIYSDDGHQIAELCRERRIVIPLSAMPDMLIKAFVSAEDSRFYSHWGVDIKGIVRAFKKNVEAGAIVQGGSTITQQVARVFLLTPEKKIERKLKEAILAYRIEKIFTKADILFLYLNQIYLGHGAYGVESAAQDYFGKKAIDLNLAECAMLAGLPKAPSKDSPFTHFDRAKDRQGYVLNRMEIEGYITAEQKQDALNMPIQIKPEQNLFIEEVPYYAEFIRQIVEEKYGKDAILTEGYTIYTAVNLEMQKIAQEELGKGLRALDKRQGYRGPLEHLEPEQIDPYIKELQKGLNPEAAKPGIIVKGVVMNVDNKTNQATVQTGICKGIMALEDMKWARKPNPKVSYTGYNGIKHPGDAIQVGDAILVELKEQIKDTEDWKLSLEQEPEVEGALLCMEMSTGKIPVMVGGKDFTKSQFNRAIQAKRQPGSAFKGLVYAAAIDKGYTPATEILDTAIVFDDGTNKIWKPQNYDRKFRGAVRVREAIAKSLNLPTVRVVQDIGVDYFIDYVKNTLGVDSNLYPNLSVALGSSDVTVLEMVEAYSIFGNLGYKITPVFITSVVDRDGNIIEQSDPLWKKCIEENSAYIMTHMLQSVIENGTARNVRALNRPAAGKTGTTNDQMDAWFIGYTPEYVTGVWVGYDEKRSLGRYETGGRAASPIWLGFMQKILEGKPVQSFEVPKGVVFTKIDADTGLLPGPGSQNIIFECFKEGTAPTNYSRRSDSVVDQENFFKMDM